MLSDNEQNLIRVGQVTEPVLELLAVYSPEFPCLIEGAAKYAPRLAKTFEGNQVKQYIEFGTAAVPRVRRATTARCTARSATARGASACRTPRSRPTPRRSRRARDIDENPPTGRPARR